MKNLRKFTHYIKSLLNSNEHNLFKANLANTGQNSILGHRKPER